MKMCANGFLFLNGSPFSMEARWSSGLVHWTSDLEVIGLSLVSVIVLFP